MHSGTGKMGRGGGLAGKKTLTAPPINRAGSASAGRLPIPGGVRGRGGASTAAISSPTAGSMQVEESFSLVRENPLNFGIAIRLAPDLVEEIKRVEAQGGTARIKFDANAKNPNGNVIHAGDKTFRFTWSKEPGDLCDVYEEYRSGEDGNGLLSEAGGTWRKLNVERELDDSTKNHVKRLSEEAERKLKSRKAIVLDHQNPSMKNQIKAVAAVDSHSWKSFKARKEPPFKKLKSETPAGGFSKSGMSTAPISKGNLPSGSPLLSLQDQHGPQASPSGYGHVLRVHASTPEVLPSRTMKRIGPDSDTHSRPPSSGADEKSKQSCNSEAKPSDLRSFIISLLQGHQDKGMTLKDLERALGDAAPNSRQIEYTLKQIAIYQASGRYVLKTGMDMESLNKQPPQSHSSPEINHHQAPELQKLNKLSSQDPSPVEAAARDEQKYVLGVSPVHTTDDVEKIDILSDDVEKIDILSDDVEKIDILGNSPEHSNEKKISITSDGMAGSSSDSRSGSGSESDSSESDSDSGSHSRSKSKQSCSASSTGTRSDASISSKQASDEDVDIMTSDDEKESLRRLQDSGLASLKSPMDYGKHDGVSGVPVTEKDFSRGAGNEEDEEPVGMPLISESKRGFDHTEENTRDRKRFKSRNSSHPVSGTLNSIFGDSPSNSSPETPEKVVTHNGMSDHIVQPVVNQMIRNPYISDTWQGVHRSSEAFVLSETSSGRRRPSKHDTFGSAVKHSEKRVQSATGFPLAGDIKEAVAYASSHRGHSSKANNRSPVMDTRSNPLQRELSDLELGELREIVYDETTVDKSQFERSHSKQLENRTLDLGCQNSELNRGKPYDKLTTDAGRVSPRNQETEGSHIPDTVASKGKATDHPRVSELKIKSKYGEVGVSKLPTATAHVEAVVKVSNDSVESLLHDPLGIAGPCITKGSKKHKPGIVQQPNGKSKSPSRSTKGSKKQRPSAVGHSNGKLKAPSTKGSNKGGSETKESSDEIARLLTKYEKETPEPKGPIKDVSQYENYVKEYQEKYESYSMLSKTLESYRNEFSKLGKELEASKGHNTKRYRDTLEQIMSLYHQCGERHKRMKKIFLLLHEELKHLKQMMKDFAASYKKN